MKEVQGGTVDDGKEFHLLGSERDKYGVLTFICVY